MTCRHEKMTEPVAVILVFAPMLKRPYPLIPADDYTACVECDALLTLVCKAVAAHPETRNAGDWTRAVVLCIDGMTVGIVPNRPARAVA